MKELAKKSISKIRSSGSGLKSEVKKNTLTAILAAFGFVIALVWRDAIKEIVNEIVKRSGIEGTGYIYQIITAVIITMICVVGIMFLSKLKGQEDVKK